MNIKIITVFAFGFLTLGTSCKSNKDTAATTYQAVDSRESNNTRGSKERGDRKGPPSVTEIFKMDSNGDGLLAKSEIKGRLLERFDDIDSNKDGFLSKEEYENAPKPPRGQRPQRGN